MPAGDGSPNAACSGLACAPRKLFEDMIYQPRLKCRHEIEDADSGSMQGMTC